MSYTLKKRSKPHFPQESSRDKKNMLDMDLMSFRGRNTSHVLTLKRLANPQPSQGQLPPPTFSQQLLILEFLELFLPTV